MRKNLLFLTTFFIAITAMAAENNYVFFETFSSVNCPPCATYNPPFEAEVVLGRGEDVHHITYHCGGLGPDPMHAFNEAQIDVRENYYSVPFYPTTVLDGSTVGHPADYSEATVTNALESPQPLSIIVSESTGADGMSRDVHVTVTRNSNDELPAEAQLRLAVVERQIDYSSAPGSNGLTHFLNIFRRMLPGAGGESILLPAMGEESVVEYTYVLEDAWDHDQMYIVAFIQDDLNRSILGSGSSVDGNSLNFNIQHMDETELLGVAGEGLNYAFLIENQQNEDADFIIEFEKNAPEDWAVLADADGLFLADGENVVTVEANGFIICTATLYIGTTAGSGEVTFTVKNPGALFDQKEITFKAGSLSGLENLIVTGDFDLETRNLIQNAYEGTFESIGVTNYLTTTSSKMVDLSKSNSLDNIPNIFYVAGNSTLDAEIAEAQTNYLMNGGNLHMSAQKLFWDAFSGEDGASGDESIQEFLTSSFGLAYNTSIQVGLIGTNTEDPDFGHLSFSSLNTSVYEESAHFDILASENPSSSHLFIYNNTNSENYGGFKIDRGNSRVVYTTFGFEMLNDELFRSDLMMAIKNYFDAKTSTGVGQLYDMDLALAPNPANAFTSINLSTNEAVVSHLDILDLQGRLLQTVSIQSGTEVSLSTSNLADGSYLVQLRNETKVIGVSKLMVIH